MPTKIRSRKIDKKMCDRCIEAVKLLGDFRQVAIDAHMVPSQISDISRYVIEPSKALLRYLGRKGFSQDWLISGRGSRYYYSKVMDPRTLKVLTGSIKKDVTALKKSIAKTDEQIDTLIELFKTMTAKG